MIIVSQDKNHHIIYENMEDICIENPLENDNGKFSIEAIGVSDRYVLGYYDTEERAKEVLQKIIRCYEDTNYEYEHCWCLRNLVYEMPKE